MSVGIMIVGLRGATASTLVATSRNASARDRALFLRSEAPFARHLDLPDLATLRWGGWDVIDESWEATVRRHGVFAPEQHPEAMAELSRAIEFPAIALADDHAVAAGETHAARVDGPDRGAAIVRRLCHDIRRFRELADVDDVILLYLATPAILPDPDDWPQTAQEFTEMITAGAFTSAQPYYMAAAIEEGVAVIDYTASATLEIPGLVDLAERSGVPLAGRDGSTGQTLLKSVLAETFATRGLRIDGWYSTNILGNHDGLVLQDERYCGIKRIDKTALLDRILGYEVPQHVVDIRYYKPAGDNKEAWDAIDFAGWFGCRGELRLNWKCSDSLLATPALIDLTRFMAFALRSGEAGIQSHLGVFFKYPLGTDERRYLRLADRLAEYCLSASTQRIHAA